MTREQKRVTFPLAAERAEKLLTRAGERFGRAAGKTTLRVRQAAKHLREEADQMDIPEATSEDEAKRPVERAEQSNYLGAQTGQQDRPGVISESGAHEPTAKRSGQANRPALERAEELVDQLGQRARLWAMTDGMQLRRAMARLREDAEDMWVEARQMRSTWKDKREQV